MNDRSAAGMTPAVSAGQRLMAGFRGTRLTDELRFLIDGLKVGGIILFARNIETPAQVGDLCRSAQEYAVASGLPPLFIAVDQEGGPVARFRPPRFSELPGAPHVRDAAEASRLARRTAAELTDMGLNMNMAPVLDVAPSEMASIMADRAYGGDPERAAEMGVAVIEGLQEKGVMAVGKHFPGIGRTVLDSHHDLPSFDGSRADLDAVELPPFAAAIRAGVSGVMLSHIQYDRIDPHWPASLSSRIAREMLRDEMGFGGLVLTDDLDMGAIKRHFDIETAAERILAAEVDVAIICHSLDVLKQAHRLIRGHLADGRYNGDASVERIMGLKSRFLPI